MENTHDGHRQRLRARILQKGMEEIPHHEIVEYLLFFVMPRRDTNPIAHALMERYGSLQALLHAPVQELIQTEGMTRSAAEWLHALSTATAAYIAAEDVPVYLLNRRDAREYIQHISTVWPEEDVWLMCLTSDGLLCRSTPLRDNACWYAPENMRLLFSETLSSHAHSVLLVQKRRIPRLTDEDLRHTEILSRALAATQVTMVEHIIADSSSRIAHYLINPHIEQSQLAEVSSLLAHWMDAE